MKVWICNLWADKYVFNTQEKAEQKLREHATERATESTKTRIKWKEEDINLRKNALKVICRLKKTEFVSLLDKFVARENIEETCDKIEEIIKGIDDSYYVQREEKNKRYKGERMYGYDNEYRIHMKNVDLSYSKVNDLADDIKRHRKSLKYSVEYKKEEEKTLSEIESLPTEELLEIGGCSGCYVECFNVL